MNSVIVDERIVGRTQIRLVLGENGIVRTRFRDDFGTWNTGKCSPRIWGWLRYPRQLRTLRRG